MNGYVCLWLREGDAHCLAAGAITASVQVQATAALEYFQIEDTP